MLYIVTRATLSLRLSAGHLDQIFVRPTSTLVSNFNQLPTLNTPYEIPSYNSTELLGCFTKYTRNIAKSSLNDYLLNFNSQYDTQPMILLTILRAGFIVNKHLKR